MVRKEFQLSEVIFKENEYQSWMYSICEGSVDIYSGYDTSDEKKLITLTEGQFFGEIGMIAVMPRTATAIAAAEHVVLEQISNEDLEDYLSNHPENLQPIMSGVSGRIRELTEDLSMITQMTNEVLRERGNGNSASGWLADSIGKLFGKLNAKKAARNGFAIQQKRQLALNGVTPPLITFHAGDTVFHAGEQADCMYHIYEGSVGIYSDYRKDNEKLLTTLYSDDVFGEMGILDNMPRSATAVCLTDCVIVVVTPENFMAFFQNKPVKILQILQRMCMRLCNLTQTYLEVCKTLEEISSPKENAFREEEAFAQLEYIRQSHLCTSMYDFSFGRDCWYDHF